MLMLTGKPGAVFRLNDDIRGVVLQCDRHQVRLGFDAPHEVHVVREKIRE